MPKQSDTFEFKWVPGTLPNPDAARRLKQSFRRPKEPMGQAWFMSEDRRYFRELCANDFREVKAEDLSHALFEISSGVTSFGFRDEWRVWFHYILAHLVEDAHSVHAFDRWSELLISAFMTQYPAGVPSTSYKGFLQDVFETLGVSMMHPDLWNNSEVKLENSLLYSACGSRSWQWNCEVSGDFSSQMFFCLKYLPSDAIGTWLQSIIKLPSRYYQAQFLLWLLGTKEIVLGAIASPADFPKHSPIRIVWGLSYNVGLRLTDDGHPYEKAIFLPKKNVTAFQKALSENLTLSVAHSWLEGFERVALLKEAILDFNRDKDFFDMFDSHGKFILYSSAPI